MTTDDDTSGFLDLAADFRLSISGLTTELRKMNDREQSRLGSQPRQLPLYKQSTNATATDVLDLGGPQGGRQWEIRLLGVIASGPAGFVAMATTIVTFWIGQPILGNAAGVLPMGMARWQFASVPNFENFSGDQIKVLPNEHLMASLTGIPAAPTQINVLGVINDLPLYQARSVVGA